MATPVSSGGAYRDPPVRRGDFGEAQLADVSRQGRLRDANPSALSSSRSCCLPRHRVRADDLQNGRVAVWFSWAESAVNDASGDDGQEGGTGGRGR